MRRPPVLRRAVGAHPHPHPRPPLPPPPRLAPRPGRRACGVRAAAAAASPTPGVGAAPNEFLRPTATTTPPPPGPAGAGAATAPPSLRPLSNAHLASLLRPHAPRLALAAACLVTCTACNLASPVLTGLVFDSLIGGGGGRVGPAAGRTALLVLAGLYALEPALTRVYIATALGVVESVTAAARAAAFSALLARPMPFFDAHGPADLTAALASDLETVRAWAFACASRDRGPRAVLEASGAVAVLTWLSWRLGPVLAAVIASAGAGAALYRVQARQPEAAAAAAAARMRGVASQAFTNVATVRACAAERAEAARFAAAADAAAAAGRTAGRAKANLEALTRAGIHASLLALFALGGRLVAGGLIPPGVLLSSLGFTYSLVYAVAGVVATVADGRRAAAAGARVRALLAEAEPEPGVGVGAGDAPPPADAAAAAAAAATGDLVLARVSFAYPSRPGSAVLSDLDLTLPRGKVTALVGRSGAGKSTVAALVSRLYAPTGGSITLGGAPIASFSRAAWARTVAYVQQDPALFAGSIADNIAYGRPGASRAEVEAAAAAAHCSDFIARLPEGLDTVVGPWSAEGGGDGGGSGGSHAPATSKPAGQLSGGQRQRLAIARALLQDAPILILDEATSALDAESEAGVQAGLRTLVAGRTVLVIAHRLSTVRSAASIAVLDGGRVGEAGPHAALAEAGGLYARLVAAQALLM